MRLDGTTLDVADTAANREAFGRPASACGVNVTGAFPQLRLVGLVETGTHVLSSAQLGAYATGEVTLAAGVVSILTPDMFCLANRGFGGLDLWQQAAADDASRTSRSRGYAKASGLALALSFPSFQHPCGRSEGSLPGLGEGAPALEDVKSRESPSF